MRPRTSLLLAIASLLGSAFPAVLFAQTFSPIADGLECVRFPDGHQEISRDTENGFEVLKSGKVRRIYANENLGIRQRLNTIDRFVDKLEADRLRRSKLLKFTNKTVVKLFGEPKIPATIPESELELKFLGLRARLEDRLALNTTILTLIDECLAGEPAGGGEGTVLSPAVMAVSIQGTTGVFFGGWVAFTEPQKHQFASTPGGYSACIKIIYQDGSIKREYSGMTDEGLCGSGTFVFDPAPPVQCDKLLPAGKVGIIKESVSIIDLTGTRTVDELLQDARLRAEATLPTVSVLAFLTENLTRDEEIALCDVF
jgi:hypothetical protein